MRTFPLSLEQKNNLLEMAQKLFSEYNTINLVKQKDNRATTITKGIEFKSDLLAFPYLDKGEKIGKYIAYKYIHWTEFCLFELAERVYVPNPLRINRNLHNQLKDFYWAANIYWSNPKDGRAKHPVDYLYEEFQSIK